MLENLKVGQDNFLHNLSLTVCLRLPCFEANVTEETSLNKYTSFS
jgi:hypothetical protein